MVDNCSTKYIWKAFHSNIPQYLLIRRKNICELKKWKASDYFTEKKLLKSEQGWSDFCEICTTTTNHTPAKPATTHHLPTNTTTTTNHQHHHHIPPEPPHPHYHQPAPLPPATTTATTTTTSTFILRGRAHSLQSIPHSKSWVFTNVMYFVEIWSFYIVRYCEVSMIIIHSLQWGNRQRGQTFYIVEAHSQFHLLTSQFHVGF